MSKRDTLIAVLVAFLWGAQVTAVKIGSADLPPIMMVAIRFAIIALILWPLCKLPQRGQRLHVLVIASVTGAVHFGLLYTGISRMDASASAIAYQLATPFTILLGFASLGERIAPHVVVGILLALGGVVAVMWAPGSGGQLSGFVLVILAAFAFAVGTVTAKKFGPFNPLAITGWTAMISFPELLLLSAITESGDWGRVLIAGMDAWLAVLYTAISGGLIGFALWYWLLGRHPVAKLSPFMLLVPVFAVLVSQLMLDESLGLNLVIGGIAVIIGIALCQRPSRSAVAELPSSEVTLATANERN